MSYIFSCKKGGVEVVNKFEKEHEKAFLKLQEMLKDIKFGSITLIVQDGKVIQIEKNEKHRLK